MEIIIKNEKDITDDWLNYLTEEVKKVSLSESSSDISNYADLEALNPLMHKALEDPNISNILKDENEELLEPIALDLQQIPKTKAFGLGFGWYKKLKRKIRKAFCSIVSTLEGLDAKDIIKSLLIALVPVFAASGGIPAIVLPIVVAIVAGYLKYGVNSICPV